MSYISASTSRGATDLVGFVLGFESQLSASGIVEILLSLHHTRPSRCLGGIGRVDRDKVS